MHLLILMLDNPALTERILEAWARLGIRGGHALESATCRLPEAAPAPGPAGLLSLGHLVPAGLACTALLLAPVESQEMAERAAEEVARIAGPWAEGRRAAMLAVPIVSTWGNIFPAAIPPAMPEHH